MHGAGGMPPSQALRYAAQIAEGLAQLHSRQVLYMDLKPANVLLSGKDDVASRLEWV